MLLLSLLLMSLLISVNDIACLILLRAHSSLEGLLLGGTCLPNLLLKLGGNLIWDRREEDWGWRGRFDSTLLLTLQVW